MDAEELLALALKLPDDQRAEIAGQLIKSLDRVVDDAAELAGVDAAWDAEAERRDQEIKTGKVELLSVADVIAELA